MCDSGPAKTSMSTVASTEAMMTGMTAARRIPGIFASSPSERSRAMKYTAPVKAPRLATASMIRNSEVAAKNAPATGLLNCLVTIKVTPRVATAEIAAPARLSVPPRATSASPAPLRPVAAARPGGALPVAAWPGAAWSVAASAARAARSGAA